MNKDPNQFGLEKETAKLDRKTEVTESGSGSTDGDLLDLAGSLHPRQKVSLIRHLITRLPSHELEVLQKIIKNEENERAQVEQQGVSQIKTPVHRIKVKKDYSFRELDLPYPQQYFISISAKYKIHGDIYLGVLFFVESGYALDYVPSKLGTIQFNPETSIFRLESSESHQHKIIRLIMLTPPPPDYDVMKIKPEIYKQVPCFLHVEILDDNLQIVEREQYQFPACMFLREVFDRDYWDVVTPIHLSGVTSHSDSASAASQDNSRSSGFSQTVPPRSLRVICQPKMQPNSPTFIIVNQAKISLMTSFLRQLAVLSQKAFPHSPWRFNLRDLNYRLLHSSKKIIVEVRVNDREVLIGEMPLNILSDWCRDLGVQISQNANSTRYTERDKEIARNLMIEFSASISDPLTFLEKFFYSIKSVQFKRKP
ncbi:hypothetical protein NDI45_25900 [Leptolyngbya sp. GB1-A1]|uniref:hypothetical protein n=1 Tax=Leptolyngbya sp. GB1-A1 TaxID=2933908 RepID=UPI003298BA3F